MIDIIKAILRSIGIDLEDVEVIRIHEDLGNGLVVPTNDWNMVFEYEYFKVIIELNKLNSKDSWMSLVKYYDGDMIDFHKVELAGITPQSLHKIITYFINK